MLPCQHGFFYDLHRSAESGDLQALKKALDDGAFAGFAKGWVDQKWADRWTPAIKAIRRGRQDLLSELLARGADLNQCDDYVVSAVLHAMDLPDSNCFDLLMAHRPSVECLSCSDRIGRSALIRAIIEAGNGTPNGFRMFNALMAAGVDVDHCGRRDGWTPLHHAAHFGLPDLIVRSSNIDTNDLS